MRYSSIQVRTRFSAFSFWQSIITLPLLLILLLLILSQTVNIASATQTPTLLSPSIEWQHTYGDLSISQAIQTSDGGYALIGTARYMAEPIGPWLLKTDSQGNEQWIQPYYSKHPDWGSAYPIVQTADGGYLLGGSFSNNTAYLLKTDSEGNIQWIHSYPSSEYIGRLIKTSDGGYVISAPYANGTGWLAKVDLTGAVQWSRSYDGVFIYTMVQTHDGGYAMTGSSYNVSNRLNTAALIKSDSQGNMIWNQTYGSSIQFLPLLQTADEGYALAGNTFRTNSSQGAVLLTKTDSCGNVFGIKPIVNSERKQSGALRRPAMEDTLWAVVAISSETLQRWTQLETCSGTFHLALLILASHNVGSVMQLNDGSYVFLVGNALTKTVSEMSLPSVTPTKTVPEFNAPVAILAVILITTALVSISLKCTHKHFQ